MISLILVVSFMASPIEMPTEEQIVDVLAQTLSTPRLTLSEDAASGLSGHATFAVAGPPGGVEIEPWLLISRLGWLFEAQGWQATLYHNAVCSWELARQRILEAGVSGWPGIWVWSSGIAAETWGTSNHVPPEEDGCFIAIVADGVGAPWGIKDLVLRGLLEALSYAHAATCSGLAGIEDLADPYTAQGFGAYKRLYVDLMTLDSGRVRELADLALVWSKRRQHAARFLEWARARVDEENSTLTYAATCFERESTDCLVPLAQMLSGSPMSSEVMSRAGQLVLQALAWHIKGMQTIEATAFSYANLQDRERAVLHAPDEEPADLRDVPLLLRLAQHPLPPVRRIAFRKLVGAPLDDESVKEVVTGLGDEDPLVAEAGLAALEAFRPRQLRTMLEDACKRAPYGRAHGDGPFLRLLVLALTRVREADVLETLSRLGSDPPVSDCRPRAIPTWCAEGITDLVGQAGWPYLVEMLESRSNYTREAATLALGRLGVEDTFGNLEAIAFRDSSAIVRCAGLGALGRLGNSSAVRELLRLLMSDLPEVRSAAVLALIEAGEGSLSVLEEALALTASDTREAFLTILAKVDTMRARKLLNLLAG